MNRLQILLRRRAAYREFWNSPAGRVVLEDLRAVTGGKRDLRVISGLGTVDTAGTMVNVGLYRVWQHIAGVLRMTDEELNTLADSAAQTMEQPTHAA